MSEETNTTVTTITTAPTMIDFEHFAALDIRLAEVVQAVVVEGADRLLQLTLDVGELGQRTVVSGIREWYSPEDLIGKQVVYLANLQPRKLRGIESQGMILAADAGEAVLLQSDKNQPNGTRIR